MFCGEIIASIHIKRNGKKKNKENNIHKIKFKKGKIRI